MGHKLEIQQQNQYFKSIQKKKLSDSLRFHLENGFKIFFLILQEQQFTKANNKFIPFDETVVLNLKKKVS